MAGHTERTRGVMTDDRDRISHRPSAIPNGSLTEGGRAEMSLNASASLPARPDSPGRFLIRIQQI